MKLFIFLLLLFPFHIFGAEGVGTFSDPVIVDAFPYAIKGTTTGKASNIDSYSCSTANESGPEVIYKVTTPAKGRLVAWLEGDSSTVDIDVHLLSSNAVSNRVASNCVKRDNLNIEADNLNAGTYYVVADTFVSSGNVMDGNYVIRIDFIKYDEFRDRMIGKGVKWKQKLYADLFGYFQTVNIIEIDKNETSVVLKPVLSTGCESVDSLGKKSNATAVVNAGFFNMDGTCASVSFVKLEGVIKSAGANRSGFGIEQNLTPHITKTNGTWDLVYNAIGGGPRLLTNSTVAVASDEGFDSSFINNRHPRTGVCYNDSKINFITFDGRTSAGGGVNLTNFGTYMTWLNCTQGMNYDGGGSTSLWIKGQPFNGIVSYPSDNSTADHLGARKVANGFGIFAQPYNNPPRFKSVAVLQANEGVLYKYDADAIDIDVNDNLVFSLTESPNGMLINSSSGVVQWTPSYFDKGNKTIKIAVTDGTNIVTQEYSLNVKIKDADNDSMPDTWEEEYNCLSISTNDAQTDSDNDSYSNLTEFTQNSNPCDKNDPDLQNPCLENPCDEENRNICVIAENQIDYICNCNEGYELKNNICQLIDLCNPNPCVEEHKTICVFENNSTACNCDNGYNLQNNICVKINPCENNPCTELNKNNCVVENDGYKCYCNDGFNFENGNCVEIKLCEPNPCIEPNRNVCVKLGKTDFTCNCNEGYLPQGETCVLPDDNEQQTGGNSSGCSFNTAKSNIFILLLMLLSIIFIKKIKMR